jgi:hypothetical protein
MCRPSNAALLVLLTLIALSPALIACGTVSGASVEYRQSQALPGPL